MNRIKGSSGPFAIFHQYPALMRLGLISTCAETTWATLLFVLTYYFKDELLVGESEQYIASKIALALLAFTAAETLLKYPMGSLADRYGPRRFVIFALSVCSVTPILMTVFGYITKSYWPLIPLRAIDGLAAAALWPAMSALMSRAVPREAKATAMSVFNAAYVLGLSIGPVAGLLLGHYLKTNLYVFPFTAGLMMIGLFIALKSIPPEAKSADMHGESLAEEAAILRGHPMLIRMMGLLRVIAGRRRHSGGDDVSFTSPINSAFSRPICRDCCLSQRYWCWPLRFRSVVCPIKSDRPKRSGFPISWRPLVC